MQVMYESSDNLADIYIRYSWYGGGKLTDVTSTGQRLFSLKSGTCGKT